VKDDEKSGTREAEAGGRRQVGVDATRTGEGFQYPGHEPEKAERHERQTGDFAIDLELMPTIKVAKRISPSIAPACGSRSASGEASIWAIKTTPSSSDRCRLVQATIR
jgi:hypothetical protein